MAEIIGLRGSIPPLDNGGEPEVIALLETILARAKAGQVVAVALLGADKAVVVVLAVLAVALFWPEVSLAFFTLISIILSIRFCSSRESLLASPWRTAVASSTSSKWRFSVPIIW